MGFLQGLKWYHEICGIKGILGVSSFRLCGSPRELTVVPAETPQPVHLRIGTSDFCSYADVLIRKTKSYIPAIVDFDPQTIIDVGAHVGISSILFALKYPRAKIFAVEPEESNFRALVRNVKAYRNIVPIRAALWRQDGEVGLTQSDAHPKGSYRVTENGTQMVRAITMTALMRDARIESIDLLKVDIEGAEIQVFADCPWIGKVGVIAIELHDRVRPGCRSMVKAAAGDFQCDEVGEVTFFRRRSLGVNSNYFTPTTSRSSAA